MRITNYRIQISRDKLKKAIHDPDTSAWDLVGQVRETPEQYFQPAVATLAAIHRQERTI
ncbi:hypothetical protein [Paenibacillus sp. 2KB_22]|uniref:hypothetical protein n=1 Tax=Paenibacillus sp. 2KB_22 TaxID=3232978 RepID=UPI003F9A9D84